MLINFFLLFSFRFFSLRLSKLLVDAADTIVVLAVKGREERGGLVHVSRVRNLGMASA